MPRTLTTDREREAIFKSLATIERRFGPPRVFVELGTRAAGSSKQIAEYLNTKRLRSLFYGVDVDEKARDCWRGVFDRFEQRACQPIFRAETTRNAARDPDFPAPCWVFVDACHCYECALEDIDTWGSKLIEGGHLVVHDTTARRAGYTALFQHGSTRPFGVHRAIAASEVLRRHFALWCEVDDHNGVEIYQKLLPATKGGDSRAR